MKKKSNWRKWLNYKLDDYITKGFRAQFALLGLAIILIITVFGIIAGLISPEMSFGSAIWQALMHMIDQGTISGDETIDAGYVGIMLVVTFLGMAFTGTIVGIINNAMSDKLDELKKGHSQIIEKGHVVIIGFDDNVYTLLSQMEESNKNWTGNRKIVVVDPMAKEDMEHLSQEHDRAQSHYGRNGLAHSEKKKDHVIYRSGSMVSENTFAMASIEKARAIIINVSDDFTVIRILLAISAYLKKHPYKTSPAIVSLMHEKENISAAEIAAGVEHDSSNQVGRSDGSKVRVLYFEEILAHIFAQVCRQPGLSWVISEIFDYADSEMYIEGVKRGGDSLDIDLAGKTFGEISEMMTNSIALGIKHGTEILLNPNPRTTVFEKGDQIIHLAEDDNQIELNTAVDAGQLYVEPMEAYGGKPQYNLLVFGWSVPLPQIIKDIDKYAHGGGTVRILTRHKSEEESNLAPRIKMRLSKSNKRDIKDIGKLKNLKLLPEEPIDPYDWETVREYLEREKILDDPANLPTNILILCQDGIDKDASDEKAAVLLLNIRNFLSKRGLEGKIIITTEMNMPEDQILLQHTSVNDFIVGSEIANRMMVQVANNPDINSVFVELLNDKGSELYLKDLSEYVDLTDSFSFSDIERSARSKVDLGGDDQQEIVLGWIVFGDDMDRPEVKLNPTGADRYKTFPVEFNSRHRVKLVVLAKNCEHFSVLG